MRKACAKLSPDALVAEVAAAQHGVVTTAQLLAAGLDYAAIGRRAAAGRLHRVHRGVYAVGHRALGNEGRWMAAVLACGDGAVLSHRSAAELQRLLKPVAGFTHVTVATEGGRAGHADVIVHRSRTLLACHTTRHRGIPATNPARTLSDLQRNGSADDYRRALRKAEFLGLSTGDSRSDGTRSELESALLRLCRRHKLPLPEVNVAVGPFTVDFLWRDQRLVVETDGWAAHRGQSAFEDDRARDVQLKLMGYEVLRFTYRQVMYEPDLVAAAIRRLLTGRDWREPRAIR